MREPQPISGLRRPWRLLPAPTFGTYHLAVNHVPEMAILTSVPLVHLEAGLEVCRREGKVAFGSQAWAVFEELDDHDGEGTPVLIYASHSGGDPRPVATWRATYLRYVRAKGGAHPKRSRYRPASCAGEDSGFWAGFYEVSDLTRLDEPDHVPVITLGDACERSLRVAVCDQ